MNPMYDVVILGCGEAGIFAGYELMRLHPEPEGGRPGPGARTSTTGAAPSWRAR